MIDHCSYAHNKSIWHEIKAWKKEFSPEQDSNPWSLMIAEQCSTNCAITAFSLKVAGVLWKVDGCGTWQTSSPQHILTHEAMKVGGETWQRSQQTSLAAGSYIQPCIKPAGSWSLCEFVIYLYMVKNAREYMRDHLYELGHDWSETWIYLLVNIYCDTVKAVGIEID